MGDHVAMALRILKGDTFGESLAGTLSRIQLAEACAESALCEALEAAAVPWDDFTHDYYDNSLELLGVGDAVMTEPQLEAIWALGFGRLWTNPGDSKRSPGERYYIKPAAECGDPGEP